jgi:predicted DNA-binding ribbon-helix-helix protein
MSKLKQKRQAGTVRTSVSLKRLDYQEIERIADQKKVSIAWVIREAVEDYLKDRAPLFKSQA